MSSLHEHKRFALSNKMQGGAQDRGRGQGGGGGQGRGAQDRGQGRVRDRGKGQGGGGGQGGGKPRPYDTVRVRAYDVWQLFMSPSLPGLNQTTCAMNSCDHDERHYSCIILVDAAI